MFIKYTPNKLQFTNLLGKRNCHILMKFMPCVRRREVYEENVDKKIPTLLVHINQHLWLFGHKRRDNKKCITFQLFPLLAK